MTRRFFNLLVLLSLLAASALAWYAYRPLPLPATPFEFELRQGSNLRGIARDMQQAGLLRQEWPFVWLVRLLDKSSQIKAGNYALTQPVSPLELVRIITEGEVSLRKISIIEGWTFRQMRAAIDSSPDIRHDTSGLPDDEILQRIGAAESHPEGLFFPDTYNFAAGSSDLNIFSRAYQAMQQHLQQNWDARMPGLPLDNPYQALILASIVEKETGIEGDRTLVAGVFVNRLRKRMLLQTDPTVIYGLGENFDGNLRKRDLLADTPHNTYTRPGLPPTPIALPGAASLQAALHPAQTDALYFVARGDGSSQFSNSLTEHNRAVNKFQK